MSRSVKMFDLWLKGEPTRWGLKVLVKCGVSLVTFEPFVILLLRQAWNVRHSENGLDTARENQQLGSENKVVWPFSADSLRMTCSYSRL